MESIEYKFKIGKILSKYLIAEILLYEEKYRRFLLYHKLCKRSRISLIQMFNQLDYDNDLKSKKVLIDLSSYTDDDIEEARNLRVTLNISKPS